jgi:formate-dependent nitrite reductase membrane component NrfD
MQAETGTANLPASHPTGHETLVQRSLATIPPPGAAPAPSYYDIPLLKKPVWSWEIGAYFFLGGLSAGSYLLARLAERAGGARYRALTRAGTAVALAALAPCPPLLIADLGDSKRFHHMLRVFKPRSPMNLGSWVLTGYSGILFLTALREWRRWRSRQRPRRGVGAVLFAAVDAVGLPLALLFSGYTGVLLSGTATPVWTKNPWLGPLFTATAVANGAAATSLALLARRPGAERPELEALEKVEAVAHVAEGVTLAGYLATAGELARPVTHGKLAPYFWGAAAAAVAGEVVRRLPVRGAARRWCRLAAAVVGVAGGLCLKWALQQAGPVSAADPEADRRASRPRLPRPPASRR